MNHLNCQTKEKLTRWTRLIQNNHTCYVSYSVVIEIVEMIHIKFSKQEIHQVHLHD